MTLSTLVMLAVGLTCVGLGVPSRRREDREALWAIGMFLLLAAGLLWIVKG